MLCWATWISLDNEPGAILAGGEADDRLGALGQCRCGEEKSRKQERTHAGTLPSKMAGCSARR